MPFMRESVHRPTGRVAGFINGKNAFMLVECVSPFPQYRDNDRNGYERLAAKFEWIACPVALKERDLTFPLKRHFALLR